MVLWFLQQKPELIISEILNHKKFNRKVHVLMERFYLSRLSILIIMGYLSHIWCVVPENIR